MSQLEEWLLTLAVGLSVYSIVVTVAWWRQAMIFRNLLTEVKKR